MPEPVAAAAPLRLRVLLAARDQLAAGGHDAAARARIAQALRDLAADYMRVVMARPQLWIVRCNAHPDWNRPASAVRPTAGERAVGAWLRGAYRRSQACERTVRRVRSRSQAERWKARGALRACARDMSANTARCRRDVAPVAGAAGYRIERAAAAVARLHALRPSAITPAELAVVRGRLEPALRGLPPALAGLPAAGRARRRLGQVRAAHPWPALDQVAAELQALLAPCSILAPSFSPRCILIPEACRMRPMRPILNEPL